MFKNTPREVWDGRILCLVFIGFGVLMHYLYPTVEGMKGILLDISKIGCIGFGVLTLIISFIPRTSGASPVLEGVPAGHISEGTADELQQNSQPQFVEGTKPTSSTPVHYKGQKKRKSMLLLISAVIGVAYILYSITYWSGAVAGTTGTAEAIGAGIATALVLPHLICTGLAVIFNILGWAMNHRGFALTGGILYSVAMVLFFAYFMFVIIEVVLSFVGFAQLKQINASNSGGI